MILVFDTETTGKADFRLPPSHPSQPNIVQLGAILLDEKFQVRGEINLIVYPEKWTIPDEVAAIHGISQDVALKFGVPLWNAVSAFDELAKRAGVFVCHNTEFDCIVMAAAFHRLNSTIGQTTHIREHSFCTMKAMTPICKLPGQYGDYKWPRLQEAYKFAFNEEFAGAHDAMADVRACARLYEWLMKREGKIREEERNPEGNL